MANTVQIGETRLPVLRTADQFDRLTGGGTQRAYRAEDSMGPKRDEILAGLDAIAMVEGRDD